MAGYAGTGTGTGTGIGTGPALRADLPAKRAGPAKKAGPGKKTEPAGAWLALPRCPDPVVTPYSHTGTLGDERDASMKTDRFSAIQLHGTGREALRCYLDPMVRRFYRSVHQISGHRSRSGPRRIFVPCGGPLGHIAYLLIGRVWGHGPGGTDRGRRRIAPAAARGGSSRPGSAVRPW